MPRPGAVAGVGDFVKTNETFYAAEFHKIQGATGFVLSWNTMAAVIGPLWAAARGVWGFYWTFLILELFAFVQIGRGLWGSWAPTRLPATSVYWSTLPNANNRPPKPWRPAIKRLPTGR